MERRKSSVKGRKPQKSKGAVQTRARAGAPKKKAKKTNIAATALGEEPAKRGLKPADTRKKGGGSAAPAGRSGAHKGAVKSGVSKSGVVKSGGGQREMSVNVKTARRRKLSSTLWLYRQLNDPFVARAKAEGYASRAAYKLIELDEKYGLIKPGARVVDLGSAPGGWCQVAVKRGAAKVVGIDYLGMDVVAGADILEMDFLDEGAPDKLKDVLRGQADIVLSDMAAPTTGHKSTDHLRIVALAEAAAEFAVDVLAPGGSFVSKVFAGGAEGELLTLLKKNFSSVRHAKPVASRSDSAEKYVVAVGFRGRKT